MSSAITTEPVTAEPPKKLKLRARRIMLTINQVDKYEEIKKNMISRKSFRYLIAGKEIAPETGHEHIHMYVEFKASTHVTQAMCCKQDVEVVKRKDQAIDYCTKDMHVLDEIGQESHQGTKTVKELVECKDPTELDPKWFKTWQAVKQWNQAMTREERYNPGIEVHYIWGDSGVGKTRWVYEQIGNEEFDNVDYRRGFWHGVSMDPSIKIAWYDDFRDSHMHPSELIKFCDYYKNNMDIKGGKVLNHYDKIYITSVQDPNKIYGGMQDTEPKRQWLRRIKIHHLVALEGSEAINQWDRESDVNSL